MIQQKFFAVTSASQASTHDVLRSACDQRDVEFVPIHSPLFDYTRFQALDTGHMVCRLATGTAAARVEQFLVVNGAASFYHTPETALRGNSNPALMRAHHGIPIPRTIYNITPSRERLRSYVEYLGGFPLVVKVLGGSHGHGVMRVDSAEALNSLVDYLDRIGRSAYLMEYIHEHIMYRLIVLGEEVVGAYRKTPAEDDFRASAVGAETEQVSDIPDRVQALAVKSVQVNGLAFGGVDILVDPTGEMVVAEANYPCHFERVQRITGVDIAGKMLDHLLAKNKNA